MTGKELIMYILQNDLENEQVFTENGFMNLISESEAAVKFDVGEATIRTWFELGLIKGVKIGNEIYVLPNAKRPIEVCSRCGHIRWMDVNPIERSQY